MKFQIVILPQAQRDVDRIYGWLVKRSVDGAIRWYERYLDSLDSLCSNPHSCGLAPEDEFVQAEIRHIIFKTRNGNPYQPVEKLFNCVKTEVGQASSLPVFEELSDF